MVTATFTEFLRTPKQVVAQTDDGAVRITRRGAGDLMLVSASDYEDQQDGVALAGRLIRAKLARDGDMRVAVRDLFAWTELFDTTELDQIAAELDKLIWSTTELGHYSSLLLTLKRWKGTAEAYADGLPKGTGQALTWLDTPVEVVRP